VGLGAGEWGWGRVSGAGGKYHNRGLGASIITGEWGWGQVS
jgi:hypothetical protein